MARRSGVVGTGARARLYVTALARYSPAELERMVSEERLDAVVVTSPDWTHAEMATRAMRAGADYFRRWHRDKRCSAGLAVHKASHHFDLMNWWLADVPSWVFASGGLRFYGDARGLGPRPARGTVDPPSTDPFALDLRADPVLRSLYWEAERHDGYLRDRDVFAPGITIEDNLAVMVGYGRGAVLTYSLNAHSPWEGYRVSVNGTAGRAELEVVERAAVLPGPDGRIVLDASSVADGGGARLTVQRHWETARTVPIPDSTDGGHGGGDALMLSDVFRGAAPDPLGRQAGYRDGLAAVAVGLAANTSMTTGQRVRVADLGLPSLAPAEAA
jgi:predicted dehydrogenase